MSKFTSFNEFKKLSPEDQLNVLLYYQDQYENSGEDQIDDATFDTLVSLYEEASGKKYREVGFLPREEISKVTLPYYMGSLDKTKGKNAEADLNRWMRTYTGPWVIEDKIDGISGLYVVKYVTVGKQRVPTINLYTRGNGTVGTDISHLLYYLRLPVPEYDIAVRGEIVIPLKDFEAYNRTAEQSFKNARNAGSGVVNSKETNKVLASKLKFYAYNIVNWQYGQVSQDLQLGYLRNLGFETPWYTIADTLIIKNLETYLQLRRTPHSEYTAPYDIDGLVIVNTGVYALETDRNPKHMIAFKVDSFIETTVLEVTWEPSKDGVLKPVVIYEPVTNFGVTMSRASGKNAKFIVTNGIGPGARILITRAGDVIPDIVDVLEPATELELPDEYYEWNENEIEFILLNPEANETVQKSKVEYFMKTMDIKNVGPGRISLLFEYGYDSLYKILSAPVSEMAQIPGLGHKSGQQIYDNIHRVISAAPLPALMAASGVFGPGFGTKRMESVLEVYPKILEMSTLSKEQLTYAISQINGFDKNSEIFAEYLPTFIDWLTEHSMITPMLPKPKTVLSNKLNGLKVVFTGFRSAELKEKIMQNGGTVVDAISKSTTLLVAKSMTDLKSKADKAKQFNIPILLLEDFKREYGLNS